MNREETIALWDSFVPAFSDMRIVIDDMVAEGNKVVARLTFYATHKGTIMKIAPTGKVIAMKEVGIFRIEGGKIQEIWEFPDELGYLTQLGAIPRAAPKK